MTKNLPRWPVHLMNMPLVDGYGVKVIDRRVITDMEMDSITRLKLNTDEKERA